jgi:hypothetical protein
LTLFLNGGIYALEGNMTLDEFLNLVAAELTIDRIDGRKETYIEVAIADEVGLDSHWWLMNEFTAKDYILAKIKEVLCQSQDS